MKQGAAANLQKAPRAPLILKYSSPAQVNQLIHSQLQNQLATKWQVVAKKFLGKR